MNRRIYPRREGGVFLGLHPPNNDRKIGEKGSFPPINRILTLGAQVPYTERDVGIPSGGCRHLEAHASPQPKAELRRPETNTDNPKPTPPLWLPHPLR